MSHKLTKYEKPLRRMFWNKQDIIPMLLTVHTSGSLEVSAELWLTRLNTWLVIIGQRIQQCHRSLPLARINTCYDIIGLRTQRTWVSSENGLVLASYIMSNFWGVLTSSGETLDRGVKRLFNISKLWNSVLLFCHRMIRRVSTSRAATSKESLHIYRTMNRACRQKRNNQTG